MQSSFFSGLVVTPGDASALADGVTVMLARLDNSDHKEIARRARERFRCDAVAATTLDDIYSTATGSRNIYSRVNMQADM